MLAPTYIIREWFCSFRLITAICVFCYFNEDALYHLHYVHYDERLGSLVKLKIIKHTSIFIVGVSNKPILESPTTFFCPNVNVTYTCHATNVDLMSWTAYPYFYGNGRVPYGPGLTNTLRKISDNFYTEATNVNEDLVNEKFVEVATVLTVITSGLQNGTNISCRSHGEVGAELNVSYSLLYFTGMYTCKQLSV